MDKKKKSDKISPRNWLVPKMRLGFKAGPHKRRNRKIRDDWKREWKGEY